MAYDFGSPWDDYHKWRKWAYEQTHGRGSWDEEVNKVLGKESLPAGLTPYESEIKKYWDEERGIGVLKRNGKFIGIACLAAKEITDGESFIRRFGLSFEKDVQWRAVSGVLDHLSRSSMFKAVLITTSNIPFKLEPDIPEELEGRLNWAKRNYEFHKDKAESVRGQIKATSGTFGPFPIFAPKQMKEEEDYARKFLDTAKNVETQIQERMKNYFLIKDNLFAAALFFYVYTSAKDSVQEAVSEIERRKYSIKMEVVKTYFVKCSDVKDPLIVFNPEFFLLPMT